MKTGSAIKHRNRFVLKMMSFIVFVVSCVNSFEPKIEGDDGLLVVDGSIIKGCETQVIRISRTSSISQRNNLPVENCSVKVVNDSGDEFDFHEESQGRYVATIDDAFLDFNKQYKLIFNTPSGETYESGYQQILKTAPVDSFYGIEEYHYSSSTNSESLWGMQFYVDLHAPEDASRYYRWLLEETWEKYSEDVIWAIYDGQTIKPFNPRDALFYCWETKDITGLYSASTVNLSENYIKKIPLNYILSTSPRLVIKYCATIKQYALNKDAYEYWHQKETELNESGQIYSIQPGRPISNIFNVNNPDEKILGFFWAASVTVKRLFFINPFHKEFGEPLSCSYLGIYSELTDINTVYNRLYADLSAYAKVLPEPPIYIVQQTLNSYYIVLSPECVDCRMRGGVNQKPDFWE
jgi:hypothetical protein